jgi:hypothetical protein
MPKAERMPFIESANLDKDHLQLLEWLQDAETSTPETEWRRVGSEDYKFYAGDQDTPEVKQLLIDQKRPITVFNEIKPKIDMLIGLAAQTKFQPTVFPTGEEDQALAELMQGCMHHFARKIKLVRKEVECFEHTTKSGRSLLYFYIDNENPFKPQIKCKRLIGSAFMLDPQSVEYDTSDARYLFIDKWMAEDEIKARWPQVDLGRIKDHTVGQGYPIFFNEQDDLYRVVEAWYWKYEKVYWFVNPMTQQPEMLPPYQFKQFAKVLEEGIPGPDGQRSQPMQVPEYTESFIRKAYYMIFTDIFKIEGGPSPYKWKGFPAVLFGAYKNDDTNTWFSAITMMKDPQVALNTMRRQLSHLLQTLPKGLLKHETGSILNLEEYEKRSADPSFHLQIANGRFDKVGFEPQPPISPIYQMFDAVMGQSIKDTGGVQDDLMGIQTTSREPGVTVQARQQTGLAVLYILFDNFRESRLEAGRILMSMIQQYVNAPEVIRIQGQNGMQLLQINTQMNQQAPDFNDITTGEYDLEVEESVENATTRLAIAQMLTDFSQNNPNSIPPDLVLEYANMPFSVKQRVKQAWESQRQLEQQNADADRAMELQRISIQARAEERRVMLENRMRMIEMAKEAESEEEKAEIEAERAKQELELKEREVELKLEMSKEAHKQKIQQADEKHRQAIKQTKEKGEQQLKLDKEKTAASIEAARQKAKAVPKEKKNGSSAGSRNR